LLNKFTCGGTGGVAGEYRQRLAEIRHTMKTVEGGEETIRARSLSCTLPQFRRACSLTFRDPWCARARHLQQSRGHSSSFTIDAGDDSDASDCPSDSTVGSSSSEPFSERRKSLDEAIQNVVSPVRTSSALPHWDDDICSLVMSFGRGRVQQSSSKNFLLLQDDEPVLEFGKYGSGRYVLDYKFPFNRIQAFACALSMFCWSLEEGEAHK
jgi:hypothetical protein